MKKVLIDTNVVTQLLGCAASSGFADKTDREIKEIMYKEKYDVVVGGTITLLRESLTVSCGNH